MAQKNQGSVESIKNISMGLADRLDRVFHPRTCALLRTFFAAVLGRYKGQNDKGIYGEYDKHSQQKQREITN